MIMIDLKYSLVIEATEVPNFFGFYSPELEGFTGVGHSIEDSLYKAKWGMEEHIELLKKEGLSVPESNPNPRVVIQNAPTHDAAVVQIFQEIDGDECNIRIISARKATKRETKQYGRL